MLHCGERERRTAGLDAERALERHFKLAHVRVPAHRFLRRDGWDSGDGRGVWRVATVENWAVLEKWVFERRRGRGPSDVAVKRSRSVSTVETAHHPKNIRRTVIQ